MFGQYGCFPDFDARVEGEQLNRSRTSSLTVAMHYRGRSSYDDATGYLGVTGHASDLVDPDYRSRLVQAVQIAVGNGAETVTDLCRGCAGAFPTDVVAAAREVLGAAIDQWPHRRWPDDALGTEDAAVPSMPEPHPIDFEWRYTAATADAISGMLGDLGGRIGCFGTPSVFVRLLHGAADAVLVDRNPGLRRHFGAHLHHRMRMTDLSQLQPGSGAVLDGADRFDTILLDPPWYVGHTLAWLAYALSSLRKGGRVVVTLFPELLRPAALHERDQLLRILRSLGRVRRLEVLPRYTTPMFESETLSAVGLADLGQWRTGELVEVTVRDPSAHRIDVPVVENPAWERVQLGRQVVAVRHDPDTYARPVSVQPVAETGSFLLRSVSARDPVRQRVTVWTSRNRGALVTGTEVVYRFLAGLADEASPNELFDTDREFAEARPALQTILALVGW